MAPWKTSTAGSARSTSTSSNRRQACLKAALRGGFLISPPLPAQTARYRPTQLAIASPYELRYAPTWRRSVEIEKNEYRRHAISRGLGRKMLQSKPISAFEFAPNECPHLFILETLLAKLTQTLNRQTKSRHRSWSRSFMYSSNASKSMRQSETGQQEKSHPVGWLCNRLRVSESYLSHVLGSTVWPALAMLRNSEAAVNITSEAEFKAVSQES